jgi:hypothetical protein
MTLPCTDVIEQDICRSARWGNRPDERSREADLRRACVAGACGKARARSWPIANCRPDVTQCGGGAPHRARWPKGLLCYLHTASASRIAVPANRHPSVVCVSATRHVARDAPPPLAKRNNRTRARALWLSSTVTRRRQGAPGSPDQSACDRKRPRQRPTVHCRVTAATARSPIYGQGAPPQVLSPVCVPPAICGLAIPPLLLSIKLST